MSVQKPTRSLEPRLLPLTRTPKEKIHWALKLLADKGHKLGVLRAGSGTPPKYEVDGRLLTAQEVYQLAARYKEWNDRRGLGTALLPRISTRVR